MVIGEVSNETNALLSSWSITNLTGGMGRFRYTNFETQLNQFWTSETVGASTWYPHAIALPPLITTIGQPSGVTDECGTAIEFLGSICTTFSTATYVLDPSNDTWSANIDTLPAAPIDVIVFNARLFYSYVGGYSYRTALTGAATDVAVGGSGAASSPSARCWGVLDNKLYTLDGDGKLYSSTTGDALSFTALAQLPYPDRLAPEQMSLAAHVDANGDTILYANTNTGLWQYDAINDKWFPTRLRFPYSGKLRGGNSGSGGYGYLAPYRESLFLLSGKSVYKYTLGSNVALIESVGTDERDGTLTSQKGWPITLIPDFDYLFMGIANSNATGIGSKPMILMWNGQGWHMLWQGDSAAAFTNQTVRAMALSYGYATKPRLYFSSTNEAGTRNFYAIELIDIYTSPLASTARKYASSGEFQTPYFDARQPSRKKLATNVRVKVADATSTETAVISYRIDGSLGAWTSLGTVNSTAETVIKFGTSNVGVEFRSIQLKVVFARTSTVTLSPKLEYLELDYLPIPDVIRGFQVQITCSDNVHGKTPGEQITNLWTAISTSTLGTFAYRDDVGNTRSYLVKIVRPAGQENTAYDERGEYTLFLAQVN